VAGDQSGQTDPSLYHPLSIFFWIEPHLNSGITVEETKAVSYVHSSVETQKHTHFWI